MYQSVGLIYHSNADVKRVKSIQFGLLSPEEIVSSSKFNLFFYFLGKNGGMSNYQSSFIR